MTVATRIPPTSQALAAAPPLRCATAPGARAGRAAPNEFGEPPLDVGTLIAAPVRAAWEHAGSGQVFMVGAEPAMRIQHVTIRNFRCLRNVEIDFSEVTTFLGPNGAGKSTILHALNWFFNGTRQDVLSADDVFHREPEQIVEVSVRFSDLTTNDRGALGKYASPVAETVTIRKTWSDGSEKILGRSLVFAPFEHIRAGGSATERKARYQELRSADQSLGLPAWTNDANGMQTLADWEAAHLDRLDEAEVEASSHFFGFVGQAQMSGLFDFIFVSADLRASEEATDARSTVIGRILAQAVDRTAADAEVEELLGRVASEQSEIHRKHYGEQLTTLSGRLTDEVAAFASGRTVRVSAESAPPSPSKTQFLLDIVDNDLNTRVDRQGHGFQRALLIAALKVLAESSQDNAGPGVVCLAIEEPELYQHPLQARLFAAVLRSLSEDRERGVQVAYATHSPYFIEAKNFHQIRRVTRVSVAGRDTTRVLGSSVERVVQRLDGFLDAPKIRRQLDGVCMGGLAEGFFAEVVLLVEGTTDRAVLTGVAARDSTPLLLDGVFVGEAGGKTSLLLPYVILEELGIPAYMVADNDSHLFDNLNAAIAAGDLDQMRKLKPTVTNSIDWNRRILRFFGAAEVDWPKSSITPNLTFVDGGLEQALESMWPGWADTRHELVSAGAGFSGKDQATYEEAALHAPGAVPEMLTALLESARALRLAA